MDCLLPARLIHRLAFLTETSKHQLLVYLRLLQARNYAQAWALMISLLPSC